MFPQGYIFVLSVFQLLKRVVNILSIYLALEGRRIHLVYLKAVSAGTEITFSNAWAFEELLNIFIYIFNYYIG